MKLARFIVKYRYIFLGLFAALAVASVFFIGKTKVNYDLKKYLPDDSDTNVSLGILESEGFGYNCMMNVMLKGKRKQRPSHCGDAGNALERRGGKSARVAGDDKF